MSAITLKKRRMHFLREELNKDMIQALVDSGAYIKGFSKRDAEKSGMKQNSVHQYYIIMNQTSFPIIRLAFLRKHSAILLVLVDTAQGTIDFSRIQITMALTDEMQKCNPKPITIETESKHTIPEQSTPIINASIAMSNDHPISGTVQPLPHTVSLICKTYCSPGNNHSKRQAGNH